MATKKQLMTLSLLFLTAIVLGWTWLRTRTEAALKPLVSSGLSRPGCAMALAPGSGSLPIDQEISRLQQEVKTSRNPIIKLEQLGWLFVKKARLSYDPGLYKLAEQCAICINSHKNGSSEGLLLRAHVLQSLHRFSEAEPLARQLVLLRGIAFDYGVLGDVLVDEGKTQEAVEAYQKMVDLKPDLQSYTRAAYIRWLTGDLQGAIELMKMAVRSGTPSDGDSAAWAYTRLAIYELQAGDLQKSVAACDAALSFQDDYAPALLARGRVRLFAGRVDEAIPDMTRAATLNPLPEYLWTLADALRAAGKIEEAAPVESQLRQTGEQNDPRTLALYLSSRGAELDTAVRLAEDELKTRSDIHTHDALAWSLAVSGRAQEAESHMRQALSENTEDARLFFHAGAIAAMLGQKQQARRWLKRTHEIRHMLLPSERKQLDRYLGNERGEKSRPD